MDVRHPDPIHARLRRRWQIGSPCGRAHVNHANRGLRRRRGGRTARGRRANAQRGGGEQDRYPPCASCVRIASSASRTALHPASIPENVSLAPYCASRAKRRWYSCRRTHQRDREL